MIVLIQPMTNVFDAGKLRPTPPLSLLAAVRLASPAHEVRLIDLRAQPDWRVRLAELLAQKPLLAATTSVTGNQLNSALEVVRFCKQRAPATPLVWGGVHATLFPDQVLDEPAVDIVVRGEGERTMAELADALAAGRGPEGIAGVSYRRDGEKAHEPERDFVDLAAMPDVDLDLPPGGDHFLVEGRPATYVETSRGCPMHCAYCYNAAFHHSRWRGEPAEGVLDRWRRLRRDRPHIAHLSIVDDNYFGKKNHALRIAEGLAREGAPFTYQVQGAEVKVLAKMSDDELRLLKDSGCVRLDMGVESGSRRMLEAVEKCLDPDDVLAVNRRLARVGITGWYNFLAGMPGETDRDISASLTLMLRLLDENPAALVSPFYLYAPYPGTALFERSRQDGYEPPRRLDGWAGLHSGTAPVPWIDRARRRTLSAAYFASIFVDRKLEVYDTRFLYRLAARLYRPIARWRLRRRFF
ncbi:MAG: B12-binding domain-containing radical SAM protein, partial [Alphaproteobacteria bacterium]